MVVKRKAVPAKPGRLFYLYLYFVIELFFHSQRKYSIFPGLVISKQV
jgi:hypothetical protein